MNTIVESRPILLIEDDENDVLLTQRAMTKGGLTNEMVVMRDGEAALNYLLELREKHNATKDFPCIILLDLKLPRLNGLEVLARLREDDFFRLIPIIILTSSVEPSDMATCYQLGCNSYIRKPVDFDQFLDVVKQLGMYWLNINEGL